MTSDHITPAVARMTPPSARETARTKVKAAENAWNSRDPEIVAQVYTENSEWRNRAEFFKGREAIKSFLKRKWEKELDLQQMERGLRRDVEEELALTGVADLRLERAGPVDREGLRVQARGAAASKAAPLRL